jgi:hypothetical protein
VCFDEKLYERTVEAKGGLIREHLSPSLLFFTAPFSCVITARCLFGTSFLRCLLQARLATFPSMSFRTTKMQHNQRSFVSIITISAALLLVVKRLKNKHYNLFASTSSSFMLVQAQNDMVVAVLSLVPAQHNRLIDNKHDYNY